MKLAALLSLLVASVSGDCASQEMSLDIGDITKMSFSGFEPTIKRFNGMGMGNKIVFKNFAKLPVVSTEGGVMTVTTGDACSVSDPAASPVEPPATDTTAAPSVMPVSGTPAPTVSSASRFALPMLFGLTGKTALAATVLALTAVPFASASDTTLESCDLVPIEVEIYVDDSVNDLVMREYQSGDYEVCPPESTYWQHHPDVYGGYEGCVGEKGLYPCAQDSQGVWEEGGALAAKYPINWDGTSCVDTGYGPENRTYWVLWGDPLDKAALNEITGLNPVVSFPFNRGPYPRYEHGAPLGEGVDDSSDARAMAKDFLEYLGAFTSDELEEFDVSMNEGAESGMVAIWAGKALEIARTTCNRDIYALMEVPAYGYSPGDSAAIANKFADSFYNGPECLCYNTSTCNEPTVTISNRGWLPLTPFPEEMGGDGIMYAANSDSAASPWFESMVFPENPSGVIKTTQITDPNRRVCDGVYVWPMYFGMRDYVVPMDERPDCSAWSFSITKAYSASVRAGFITYKKEPTTNHDAMTDAIGDLFSMTHGLYSEWSWHGQMQLWEMMMSKPITEPTSWIGAYIQIMDAKWNSVISGFDGCPVVTVTNPKAGAYVWFKYNDPYLGIQGGFVSSFFRDVLGIRTTTYNWGFRGADPADYYGEGYTTTDFTRLQLYRDGFVYEEIARRAMIVCADPDAVIGDFISVNQWVAGEGTTTRRLGEGYSSTEERKLHYKEVIPGLNERQLEYLAKSHENSDRIDRAAETCAPDYSTNCLFKAVGTRHADF